MDSPNLPVQIDEYKIAKFVDVEGLASFINSIPIVPGTNTVAGIMLACNYKRQEQFLIDVIEDRLKIAQSEVDKTSFLKRFYLTSQVVAKAQTQEKYNRFKKLLINSTIYEISDNDYELYNNLIDEITDKEFIYLKIIVEKTNLIKWGEDNTENRKLYDEACSELSAILKIDETDIESLQIRMYSKGLIVLTNALGGMVFSSVSRMGFNFIEFIGKDGEQNA